MAPLGGHALLPKAIKAIRLGLSKTGDLLRAQLPSSTGASTTTTTTTTTTLHAIPVRANAHPLHRLALLRQARGVPARGLRTAIHRALAQTFPAAFPGAGPATSHAAASISRAPLRHALNARPSAFAAASPLRPHLTAGTLRRTAGTARHFSSAPAAAPAHVVQHVSAAMRAFWGGGLQARFAGADPTTGASRWRAVGPAEARAQDRLDAACAPRAADVRGASLIFDLAPPCAAFTDAAADADGVATLDSPAVLTGLATDFARSLAALARVHADLKRLSALGALEVTRPDKGSLAVRFPGCDGAAIEALCDELGVVGGVVVEDAAWTTADDDEAGAGATASQADRVGARDVEMALLFPWAPSGPPSAPADAREDVSAEQRGDPWPARGGSVESVGWRSMVSGGGPRPGPTVLSPGLSSSGGGETEWVDANLCDGSGGGSGSDGLDFERLAESDGWGSHGEVRASPPRGSGKGGTGAKTDARAFEGVEGIYRFLTECEGR